jgi:hypothetical protein
MRPQRPRSGAATDAFSGAPAAHRSNAHSFAPFFRSRPPTFREPNSPQQRSAANSPAPSTAPVETNPHRANLAQLQLEIGPKRPLPRFRASPGRGTNEVLPVATASYRPPAVGRNPVARPDSTASRKHRDSPRRSVRPRCRPHPTDTSASISPYDVAGLDESRSRRRSVGPAAAHGPLPRHEVGTGGASPSATPTTPVRRRHSNSHANGGRDMTGSAVERSDRSMTMAGGDLLFLSHVHLGTVVRRGA